MSLSEYLTGVLGRTRTASLTYCGAQPRSMKHGAAYGISGPDERLDGLQELAQREGLGQKPHSPSGNGR